MLTLHSLTHAPDKLDLSVQDSVPRNPIFRKAMAVRLQSFTLMVLMFAFLSVATPVFGQQFETIYPNGLVAIADKPLPSKIYLAQKNTLETECVFKRLDGITVATSWGSGFVESKSGLVISARHVLIESIMDIVGYSRNLFRLDSNGIPQGIDYNYKCYAFVRTRTTKFEYPLEVVGIGLLGTYVDVIAFKSSSRIPVSGLVLSDIINIGDKVYTSGFAVHTTHYHHTNGNYASVTTDEIKYNFEKTVLAMLTNDKLAKTGTKKLYRLSDRIMSGFSGGPVLNKNGEVVGITVETNESFTYAISAQDISTVLKSIK